MLAFWEAVGQEGRNTLKSLGFNITRGNFDVAFALLHGHYGRKENLFVKTQQFVSLSQVTGEDDRDYLFGAG